MRPLNFVSADEAMSVVKPHDHIHISSAAHVPFILIEALCRRADAGELEDIHFHHFYTEGPALYADPKYKGIFIDQAFFVGPTVRPSVNLGVADYIPVHLADTQKLYRSGAVKCDVAYDAVTSIIAKTGEIMNGLVVTDLKEDANGNPIVTEINIRHVAFTSTFAKAGLSVTVSNGKGR